MENIKRYCVVLVKDATGKTRCLHSFRVRMPLATIKALISNHYHGVVVEVREYDQCNNYVQDVTISV